MLKESEIKEIDFFAALFHHDSRKVILNDHLGTIAIIDHHAHLAWLEATREEYQTDRSIHYTAAVTADFIKVSRKRQFNLENWLFKLTSSTNSSIGSFVSYFKCFSNFLAKE